MPRHWSSDLLTALRHDATLQAIVTIVALSFVIALAASRLHAWRRRRPRRLARSPTFGSRDARGPLAQIEAVAHCDFERWPLLNREEARLLPLLEQVVAQAGGGHRLMAQTCLGELIRPVGASGTPEIRRRGFASINAKRLDFAIIDRDGYLALAIEYQGSGHYHADSFMRDAVKREALRKAGVATIEIPARYDAEEIRARLMASLGRPAAPARTGT